ncbi:MAG: 16S rRNA (adenine(1518)-N(6)/adenine(1519)-N(6))-dimethyltransferase [Flavobacteriales bacterium]|nr:MAG: 16S rRNA (adenine(1518)-N(6)/adenine(1519)-N(6))-dimethyltransferase [Flavobacteriales bacterium]
MGVVKPKKHLGQHFLTDQNIAKKVVDSLSKDDCKNVIEIGPGMGVLTQYLLKENLNLKVIEIDKQSVDYLQNNFPELKENLIHADFLKLEIKDLYQTQFKIIGNFPFNISSPILFKVLDNRELVVEVVGMLQKEVAERISAKHGSKTYGILSVLLQAFFEVEYLFTVSENVFNPPPRVKSAVIRLTRKDNFTLDCNEDQFRKVVKAGFSHRRKTLRNALKSSIFVHPKILDDPIFDNRAEQLSVTDFVELTKLISENNG